MKKIRIGMCIVLIVCALSTIFVGAYSADDKVAGIYRENNTSSLEYRYLKMQATYNYSLWDRMVGDDQAIIRVHMGVLEDLQYYKKITNAKRNNTYVNPVAIYWDDSRDNESGYNTYEYFVHYSDIDNSTYNVTFWATLQSNMYMTATTGDSKCRFWTGQFYGDIGDNPFSVCAGYYDPVIPTDYYQGR